MDAKGKGRMSEAIPAWSPSTRRTPTLLALRNATPQSPAQMPIRAPALTPVTSVRPPRMARGAGGALLRH